MKKVGKVLNLVLNWSIITIFSIMVVLVFLNAFLRYSFNSGITWSEELSRYSFVWIVFLGAVVAFKEGEHIIVDLLISKFPRGLQNITFLVINLLVIGIMILFVDGLSSLIELNKGVEAPASGIPKNTLYAVGVISSVSIILISAYQTIRVLILNKEKPAWMLHETPKEEGDVK